MSTGSIIKRFLKDWIFPRKLELAGVFAVTAGLATVTGGYPLIIQQSFDSLLAGSPEALPFVLAAVVALTAARSTFLYINVVLSNRFVVRISTDIKKAAFRYLIASDFARLTRESPGHLVSRVTAEVGFIEGAMNAALVSAVREPLSVLVLVGTMFYLDWVMALIVLCVYPVAAWPIIKISKALRRLAKRTQQNLGGVTSLLTEQLSSARLVKTYRLEDVAVDRVSESLEHLRDLRITAVRRRARIEPMLEALGGVAIAGVIGLAYWRISSGQSTVGDFMGFVSALLMAAQPIRGLGNLTGRLQEGLAAAERFYGVVDERPVITDMPGAQPLKTSSGTLRFENVSFAYSSAKDIPALNDVTLEVPGGLKVALVGRSGAGKSTLVNLVPRLFDATEGRITIDGQDIRHVTLDSLRDSIAIVSQDVTLFDDTIRANIALGRPDATEEEIEAAARAAAADEFIRAQPNGYETQIGSSGSRLSGGQRQRIALARAILRDAPILLLDEATSSLDAESERLVQDALKEFAKDRTTLVIAHRLATVQDADMICVMDQGRVVETGTHSQLLAHNGIYADLCSSQFLASADDADRSASNNSTSDHAVPER